MVGRRQRDCAGVRGAGGLPRPGVLPFVYAPGIPARTQPKTSCPDCGKDRALNSGHRAVPAVFPALHAAGVEGEIGRFRRRHMTPVPRAASLAELNQMLADADEVDEHRRIAARVETVGQAAAREVPLLNPLPGNAFRAAALSCRVDAKAICVRQSYFSVPARARRPPGCKVALGADWIDVRHDGVLVARHTPLTAQGAARTWCWTTT